MDNTNGGKSLPPFNLVLDEVDTCDTISLPIFGVSVEGLFYPCTLKVLYYSGLRTDNPFYILRIYVFLMGRVITGGSDI